MKYKGMLWLCLLLLLASGAAGEVYTWRDAEGKLHFSDRPAIQGADPLPLFDSDGGSHPAPPPSSSPSPPRIKAPPPISAGDYRINPSLQQKGDYLYLSGRIEGGPVCRRLVLRFSCLSEEGRQARVSLVAENLGGFLSERLEARTKVPGGSDRTRWEVVATSARCQD